MSVGYCDFRREPEPTGSIRLYANQKRQLRRADQSEH